MINYSLPSIDIELVWPPHRALMLVGYVCGLTWTVCSVLQTKVHEVVILVLMMVMMVMVVVVVGVWSA